MSLPASVGTEGLGSGAFATTAASEDPACAGFLVAIEALVAFMFGGGLTDPTRGGVGPALGSCRCCLRSSCI